MPDTPPLDVSRDAVKAQMARYREIIARLTPRELEVAKDVVLCLTAEESGQRLGLSKKTVDVYRLAIHRALGVRSSAQVVRIMTLAGY